MDFVDPPGGAGTHKLRRAASTYMRLHQLGRLVAGAAIGGACVGGFAAASVSRRPFRVSTGCCKGEYDGVLISTDLEPDDAAALKALAPRLRGTPLLVVVGEGDAPGGAKCTLAAEILASYGLDERATIVQGRRSSAAYPGAALRAYSAEGRPRQHRATIIDEADVAGLVDRFCASCDAPFALLLKPPHEMLGLPADSRRRVVAAV